MNVMITRAIALLIIIGHNGTLSGDRSWKQLIEYIADNKGLVCGAKKLNKRIQAPIQNI